MDLLGPVITLSIGVDAAILQVHQGVLCRASEFFKIALKPEWTKQRTEPHTITLLDDYIEDVSLYVLWLYSREIRARKAEGTSYDVTNDSDKDLLAKVLIEAYIYGQKVMDDDYKQAVIKEIVHLRLRHDWFPEPDVLCMAYDATTKGCSLRKLLEEVVSYTVYTGDHPEAYWDEKIRRLPQQLLANIVIKWAWSVPWDPEQNGNDPVQSSSGLLNLESRNYSRDRDTSYFRYFSPQDGS